MLRYGSLRLPAKAGAQDRLRVRSAPTQHERGYNQAAASAKLRAPAESRSTHYATCLSSITRGGRMRTTFCPAATVSRPVLPRRYATRARESESLFIMKPPIRPRAPNPSPQTDSTEGRRGGKRDARAV